MAVSGSSFVASFRFLFFSRLPPEGLTYCNRCLPMGDKRLANQPKYKHELK